MFFHIFYLFIICFDVNTDICIKKLGLEYKNIVQLKKVLKVFFLYILLN